MEYHGLTLDPFQERAIALLEAGRSVLVTAPTGTGKTIIADRVVERALERGRRVIYTAPVKALSNQKFRDYGRLHGEERVGLVTGDLVIRRDAPCLVMTTEILRNMLLAGEDLDLLDAVILDEIHFLADRERGTVWEEVLIYLPSSIQVLGLSATLSNRDEFAAWLSEVRGSRVEVVVEERRTVPLRPLYANRSTGLAAPDDFERAFRRWRRSRRRPPGHHPPRGPRRGRRRGPVTRHTDVFTMLRPDRLPCLYFVFSRRQAERFARDLGGRLERSLLSRPERLRMRERLSRARDLAGPDVLDEELSALYRKGVAFHHAGLHVQLKALVEQLYEERLLKILYTTSTFALGINVPARTVVLDDVQKFDGRSRRFLTVREFMQKAGRAGRRGMDEEGFVVVRLDFETRAESRDALRRYLRGDPEPVHSSFNLSFNSVVNLLDRYPGDEVRSLVERSFLAFALRRRTRGVASRAREIERSLRSAGWVPGDPPPRELRGSVSKLKKLRRRASSGTGRAWADFERRRSYLVEIGYLDRDGTFNAGARVLRLLQIQEILATELVLSGMVEELDDAALFGVLCAMTGRLPRGLRLRDRLRGEDRRLALRIEALAASPHVRGADRITGVETACEPALIPFGRSWALGRPLSELSLLYWHDSDCSGQIVSTFRRAKDLCGQLREVYREDPASARRMAALVRRVSRDEVEVVD